MSPFIRKQLSLLFTRPLKERASYPDLPGFLSKKATSVEMKTRSGSISPHTARSPLCKDRDGQKRRPLFSSASLRHVLDRVLQGPSTLQLKGVRWLWGAPMQTGKGRLLGPPLCPARPSLLLLWLSWLLDPSTRAALRPASLQCAPGGLLCLALARGHSSSQPLCPSVSMPHCDRQRSCEHHHRRRVY